MSVLTQIPTVLSGFEVIPGWVPLLTLGHAIILCYGLRRASTMNSNAEKFPLPVLHGIVTVWVLGVGGSTLTAILFGNTGPAKFLSTEAGIFTYSLAALLILYVDSVYLAVHRTRYFVLPLCALMDGFSRAGAILYAVEPGISAGIYLPTVLAGILAGSGGGLLGELIGINYAPSSSSRSWSFGLPVTLGSSNPLAQNKSFALSFFATLWAIFVRSVLPVLVNPGQQQSTAALFDSISAWLNTFQNQQQQQQGGGGKNNGSNSFDEIARLTVFWLCGLTCLVGLNAHLYEDGYAWLLQGKKAEKKQQSGSGSEKKQQQPGSEKKQQESSTSNNGVRSRRSATRKSE